MNSYPVSHSKKSGKFSRECPIPAVVAQGKVSNGIHLSMEGKVLKKGGVITDGPFVKIRERFGSLTTIKAENSEEAITLVHRCQALNVGAAWK